MGKGFAKKKKHARMMQEQIMQMKHAFEATEAEGVAANGLVTILLGGDHEMKRITIKPECVDPEDVEGLQDLIKAAYKDAMDKLQLKTPNLPNIPADGGFPDLSQLGL